MSSGSAPFHAEAASAAPFVVGVGRSGTTLLRLMLDAHPALAIPPETHFLMALLAHPPGDAGEFIAALTGAHTWPDFHLDAAALAAEVRALSPFRLDAAVRLFYRAYARRFGKSRWGDKSPPYIECLGDLAQLLPEARFIHIIRDGRDVALSFRDKWFGPGRDIADAARFWRRRILAARQAALAPERYLEVRYEELLRSPEEVLRRICRFIDLDFAPAMLDYHRGAAVRLAEVGDWKDAGGGLMAPREKLLAIHQHTHTPPDLAQIGKWREALTAQEQATFLEINGDLLRELDYETMPPTRQAAQLGLWSESERKPSPATVTFVLGMHRSGTSAVTRLLNVLGLDVGDHLLPPRQDNPEGFFEDVGVVDLNRRLLNLRQSAWYLPVDPAAWSSADADHQAAEIGEELAALADEARALLADRLSSRATWLVKDPRLCLLLPFWLERLAEQGGAARFIWVLRHPDNVAASLAARDGFSLAHGRQLWLSYNLAILRHLQERQAWLLDYDQLLARQQDSAACLVAGLGLPVDTNAVAAACGQALRPELRHNRVQDAPAHPLYQALGGQLPRRLARAELTALWGRWQAELPDLDGAWRWAAGLDDTVRRQVEELAAADARENLLREGNESLHRDVGALRGDVEALRGDIAAMDREAASLRNLLAETRGERDQLHNLLAETSGERDQLRNLLAGREAWIEALLGSTSWRITAPLRWLSALLRGQSHSEE